jgi:large subunit ribosomal protein L14
MLQHKSILKVADNTGVKYVKCLKVLRTSLVAKGKQQIATSGHIILVSVIIKKPNIKIKKGQLFRALVVRVKGNIKRIYGNISFSDNWVVLLNKKEEPVGNRIFGIISLESLESNFVKFESIRILTV